MTNLDVEPHTFVKSNLEKIINYFLNQILNRALFMTQCGINCQLVLHKLVPFRSELP